MSLRRAPFSLRTWAVAILVIAPLMAGCGGDRRGPNEDQAKRFMRGLDGREGTLRPGADSNAIYAEAMALKAHGKCAEAAPKLRQVAGLGPGFEGAQTALGECLTQGQAGDGEVSADYLEGLTWLRRAADAGWPEAQGRLADIYALGPVMVRNADEAGYWLALYLSNPGKSRVGFVPLPAGIVSATAAAIPADAKARGAARADKWERKVWMPPTPPKEDKDDRHHHRRHSMESDGDE
jgi:hypothetical protein